MNKKTYRILIVDHDQKPAWDLADALRDDGYEVTTAYSGLQALAITRRHRFDLIVLDVDTPGGDGFQVCSDLRRSRASSSMPIMLVSTRSAVADRVRGLDQGGDDYLGKPFDISELKARVRALLRRGRRRTVEAPDIEHRNLVLKVGPLSLLLEAGEVRVGSSIAKLTPKELDLLHYLMLHFSKIVSSKELLQMVWGYHPECKCTGVVRWHIKSLRDKIEPTPSHPIYLRTVPHQGYILRAE